MSATPRPPPKRRSRCLTSSSRRLTPPTMGNCSATAKSCNGNQARSLEPATAAAISWGSQQPEFGYLGVIFVEPLLFLVGPGKDQPRLRGILSRGFPQGNNEIGLR